MDRLGIETRENYIERNIQVARTIEAKLRKEYVPRYRSFLKRWNVMDSSFNTVCEIGPGPTGGFLTLEEFKGKTLTYIDYMMDEWLEAKHIEWPKATYINSPAEEIPIDDNTFDMLLSYNCIDHGWDIKKCITECIRVSKVCYINFDCRGDNKKTKEKKDIQHFQKLNFNVMYRFLKSLGAEVRAVKINHPFKCCEFKVQNV